MPPEVGRIIIIKTGGMTVELENPESINLVIDQLRLRQISIRSVQPVKVSLERSFVDAVTEPTGGTV